MRRFGMQFGPDLLEDAVEGPDVDLFADFVEDLHEAAHVRPLEVMAKAHIHVDRGVDRLCPVGAIQDDNGVFEPLDPHFLDIDVPVVFLILDVDHRL